MLTATRDRVPRVADLLSLYPYIVIGSMIAMIVACVFGMKPRLEEYWA